MDYTALITNLAYVLISLLLLYLALTHKVEKCADGDTFTIKNRFKWQHKERIRIYALNCPEKGFYHWKESGDALRSLILGKRVFLKKVTQDKYGRSVCKVYRLGFDVTALMILKGKGKEYQGYTNGKYKKYEYLPRLFRWGVWNQ